MQLPVKKCYAGEHGGRRSDNAVHQRRLADKTRCNLHMFSRSSAVDQPGGCLRPCGSCFSKSWIDMSSCRTALRSQPTPPICRSCSGSRKLFLYLHLVHSSWDAVCFLVLPQTGRGRIRWGRTCGSCSSSQTSGGRPLCRPSGSSSTPNRCAFIAAHSLFLLPCPSCEVRTAHLRSQRQPSRSTTP